MMTMRIMDVTDKIVVAIAGEPKNEDGTYLMSGY